jgi:hypothetical protein
MPRRVDVARAADAARRTASRVAQSMTANGRSATKNDA